MSLTARVALCILGLASGCRTAPVLGVDTPGPSECDTDATAQSLMEYEQSIVGPGAIAGLQPLASDTLPTDVREVRLWYRRAWYGTGSVLQIRARGDSVTGALIVFARSPMHPPGERPVRPRSCRPLGESSTLLACEAVFPAPVDWRAVLTDLEAYRVWTLPDPSTLPPLESVVTDGHGVLAEVRRGSCYHRYSYGNPDAYSIPEYRDAAGIMRVEADIRSRWNAAAQ